MIYNQVVWDYMRSHFAVLIILKRSISCIKLWQRTRQAITSDLMSGTISHM